MIPTANEQIEGKVYKRISNSAYEYEKTPCIIFRCRLASSIEKKKYRVMKGVNATTDSTFLYATNLPYSELKDGDKIELLGKIWTVESVGYYFEQSKVVNSGVMNDQYLFQKCPKGVTIL